MSFDLQEQSSVSQSTFTRPVIRLTGTIICFTVYIHSSCHSTYRTNHLFHSLHSLVLSFDLQEQSSISQSTFTRPVIRLTGTIICFSLHSLVLSFDLQEQSSVSQSTFTRSVIRLTGTVICFTVYIHSSCHSTYRNNHLFHSLHSLVLSLDLQEQSSVLQSTFTRPVIRLTGTIICFTVYIHSSCHSTYRNNHLFHSLHSLVLSFDLQEQSSVSQSTFTRPVIRLTGPIICFTVYIHSSCH